MGKIRNSILVGALAAGSFGAGGAVFSGNSVPSTPSAVSVNVESGNDLQFAANDATQAVTQIAKLAQQQNRPLNLTIDVSVLSVPQVVKFAESLSILKTDSGKPAVAQVFFTGTDFSQYLNKENFQQLSEPEKQLCRAAQQLFNTVKDSPYVKIEKGKEYPMFMVQDSSTSQAIQFMSNGRASLYTPPSAPFGTPGTSTPLVAPSHSHPHHQPPSTDITFVDATASAPAKTPGV